MRGLDQPSLDQLGTAPFTGDLGPRVPSIPPGALPAPPESEESPKNPPGLRWAVLGVAGLVLTCLTIFVVMVGREVAGLTIIENLEQGQCIEDYFDQSADGEFVEVLFVRTTECGELHAYEVYAVADIEWGVAEYPGVEEAFGIGDRYCFDQYNSFVGGDYASSPYEFLTFVPTADLWESGDRSVQCLVGNFDGETLTTGSLENAGRLTSS